MQTKSCWPFWLAAERVAALRRAYEAHIAGAYGAHTYSGGAWADEGARGDEEARLLRGTQPQRVGNARGRE